MGAHARIAVKRERDKEGCTLCSTPGGATSNPHAHPLGMRKRAYFRRVTGAGARWGLSALRSTWGSVTIVTHTRLTAASLGKVRAARRWATIRGNARPRAARSGPSAVPRALAPREPARLPAPRVLLRDLAACERVRALHGGGDSARRPPRGRAGGSSHPHVRRDVRSGRRPRSGTEDRRGSWSRGARVRARPIVRGHPLRERSPFRP